MVAYTLAMSNTINSSVNKTEIDENGWTSTPANTLSFAKDEAHDTPRKSTLLARRNVINSGYSICSVIVM